VGHPCERPAQHGVKGQLVYILCDGLSMDDLRLAAGHQSGHLEYVEELKFKLTATQRGKIMAKSKKDSRQWLCLRPI
jgi:hypothetical protein